MPDEKIIELLAWLIDFTPRPHEFGRNYPINPNSVEDIGQHPPPITQNEPTPEQPTASIAASSNKTTPVRKTSRKKRGIIIALSILVLGGAGIYFPAKIASRGPQACMYWSGDRYLPIPCDHRSDNTLVIPLDSEKIVHFRKITRPDTITENALGSIWFTKYHNGYECYTAPGYHPIDTNLRLQVLTDYVLIKHIHPGLQPTALLPQQ